MASSPTDPVAPEGGASRDLISVLEQGRRQFLALVADVRPELLRYCARMTGSVADGEDVVQETLARAYYELSQLAALPPLRPWLFRIAHHRAIDHWRHETYRVAEPLEAADDVAAAAALEPENALARRQAVGAALSCFIALAPAQRGCVILKDVLEHSLDEIAAELGLSVPAVKAALHRGRAALLRLGPAQAATPAARTTSPALRALREALQRPRLGRRARAARRRCPPRSRLAAQGRRPARRRRLFRQLRGTADWRVVPAWLDGREVVAVFVGAANASPSYFIELGWIDGRVTSIRDFRYVPYIAQESAFDLETTP